VAKYDSLGRYLSRRSGAEIQMSFAEIERLIGAMLPNGAARPQWWANDVEPSGRHVQARAWLDAGYDAFLVDGAERVRFTRRGQDAAPAP
jgi:hypothetical protein